MSGGPETSGGQGTDGGRKLRRPSQLAQIVGSILVALVIAAIAVGIVTAHFGSTPVAELEAREERIDARLDAREERQKAREDSREERQKAAEDRASGNGGPG